MSALRLLKEVKGRKKISFIGLGKSNLGVLNYLKANFDNLEFTLRSKNQVNNIPNEITHVKIGKDYLDNIYEDILFFSPAVRRDNIKGDFIASSDAELFFEICEKEKIIGISGSDGKSTTSSITHAMLIASSINASLCGNIGKSMCQSYLENPKADFFVCELSSFQLLYSNPKVKRAAITNITPNHLNWHKDFYEYSFAKEKLIKDCDDITLNLDCEHTQNLVKKYKPRAVFTTEYSFKELGDIAPEVYTLSDGYILKNGQRIIDTSDIKAKGLHNIKNFMCALSLCEGLISKKAISDTAKDFMGLPHRQRVIYDKCGVRAIDSSIDSSPMRTKATLESLEGKYTVILGGSDKGLDYSLLTPVLKKKASAVVFTGENMTKMLTQIDINVLKSSNVYIFTERNFDSAVRLAIKNVRDGGNLILSPASASYDAFSNFEERGKRYRDIVLKELK